MELEFKSSLEVIAPPTAVISGKYTFDVLSDRLKDLTVEDIRPRLYPAGKFDTFGLDNVSRLKLVVESANFNNDFATYRLVNEGNQSCLGNHHIFKVEELFLKQDSLAPHLWLRMPIDLLFHPSASHLWLLNWCGRAE